jgi:hypothetical protein
VSEYEAIKWEAKMDPQNHKGWTVNVIAEFVDRYYKHLPFFLVVHPRVGTRFHVLPVSNFQKAL